MAVNITDNREISRKAMQELFAQLDQIMETGAGKLRLDLLAQAKMDYPGWKRRTRIIAPEAAFLFFFVAFGLFLEYKIPMIVLVATVAYFLVIAMINAETTKREYVVETMGGVGHLEPEKRDKYIRAIVGELWQGAKQKKYTLGVRWKKIAGAAVVAVVGLATMIFLPDAPILGEGSITTWDAAAFLVMGSAAYITFAELKDEPRG